MTKKLWLREKYGDKIRPKDGDTSRLYLVESMPDLGDIDRARKIFLSEGSMLNIKDAFAGSIK